MAGGGPVTAFADLHRRGTPLVLPNAWDYASAAALAGAGFAAVGTTSLGVAAANGLPDAAGVTRDETVELARRIVRLSCPVTVDVEAGFSTDPAEVAALAAELAGLGVAGINLEDGRPAGLAQTAVQCELIRAVKARVPALFLNARIDTHWLVAQPAPLAGTLARARAYVAAGADGVFVPGLVDPGPIASVVAAVPVPVNVLYAPGRLGVADLARLGVARISYGSLLFRFALGAAVRAALGVAADTAPDLVAPSYVEVQRLVAP